MVVAVPAVRVVQVPVHEVVGVVAVGDGLVPAARAVDVAGLVRVAAVLGGAPVGMLGAHVEHELVDVRLVRAVQGPVVQVVDVVAVLDGRVPAAGAVDVPVLLVLLTGHGARVARRAARLKR